MSSWQSTRPSVSTVLTKFPLYWTIFIQKYYIHREQRWRIKLHLEKVSSCLRVKTNRMVKNNRNIVSSHWIWLRLEMRKTRIPLLWCIQYYVSQKNLVKLITRYTQSVNGMGSASFMLSTHWHRMWHICNSKLNNRCTYQALSPEHFLEQIGLLFKCRWNLTQNKTIHARNWIWKCHLQSGGHFVRVPMCLLTVVKLPFPGTRKMVLKYFSFKVSRNEVPDALCVNM